MKTWLIICTLFLFFSCTSKLFVKQQEENLNSVLRITDGKYGFFSPKGGENGMNLVFTKQEKTGFYNIYMKAEVLSNAIVQKTTGYNFNLNPDYCEATKNIVFQYYDWNNFDIYYLNAMSGKAITQVTNSLENEYNPSWSKDGELIVFERGIPRKYYGRKIFFFSLKKAYLGFEAAYEIWIKNIRTGQLKLIGEGQHPAISPDGKNIAFIKCDKIAGCLVNKGLLWIMDIDGNFPRQVTFSDMGYVSYPCWSPDGMKIIFSMKRQNKSDIDIYSIGIDGNSLMQHTSKNSDDFAPHWTSDGYIYFCSDRESFRGIYHIWRFQIK